jgi:hypothetical protein
MEGHKGSDPDHPEILCDDNVTEKLVSKNKHNTTSFNIFNSNSTCCRLVMLTRCRRGTGLRWTGRRRRSMWTQCTLLEEVHHMGGRLTYCTTKINAFGK